MIDYNAIQKEIEKNLIDLQNSDLDVFEFMHDVTMKFIKPHFKLDDNDTRFADLIFAMLEINDVELH